MIRKRNEINNQRQPQAKMGTSLLTQNVTWRSLKPQRDYPNLFALSNVISSGVEFLRKISKFEKNKINSSLFVHILHKTWKKAILRRSRAVKAKKCTKTVLHVESCCFSNKPISLKALSKCPNWSAGPVVLTMKNAFFQEFLLKHHFLRACYLGSDRQRVLIKSEILLMTGMVWPVSSNNQSARPVTLKWDRLFPRVFAEKPSPSYILFKIWLIWLDRFD